MIKREELTDTAVEAIIAEMIRLSLEDLFKEPETRPAENKQDAINIVNLNRERHKNQRDALIFFTKSEMFKKTGLSFEYLLEKWRATYEDQST